MQTLDIGGILKMMILLHALRFLAKHLAVQLAALVAAVGYVLLSNALPGIASVAAGSILASLLAVLVWRFVKTMKDPAQAVRFDSIE